MTNNNFHWWLHCLLLFSISFCQRLQAQTKHHTIKVDSVVLFDQTRNRNIPLTLYVPKNSETIKNQRLVIFNHGYNANQPGSSKNYSYITEKLASLGYFVASIQHELPSDSLIPTTGIPQILRRSNWERGVANILFTLNELKRLHPNLDDKHVVLMGHSNGGDMIMLFAQLYPQLAEKIISLDNRRVAFPRTHQPKIYSLRSSDQPADEGVLPTAEEQEKYSIKIIQLSNTIHNDMGNNANKKQRKEINGYILGFLND